MQTTLATRKPIDSLTVEDLEAFPIWEFATDEEHVEGMDETWVKPVSLNEIPQDAFALSVASVFKLNCGRVYPGLMCCDTYADFEVTAVAFLTKHKRYVFSGSTPASILTHAYSELGLSSSEVFPLHYRTRVPLAISGLLAQGIYTLPATDE